MPIAPGSLDNFSRSPFAAGGMQYDVYRRGEGPAVVLLHEIPGLSPEVLGLAEWIAAANYHVVVPSLFGSPGQPAGWIQKIVQLGRACISREFRALAFNESGTLTEWLRPLCREVYRECRQWYGERSGPGIGVIGLCVTGNFALALLLDPEARVVAPVMGEPSLPLPLGPRGRGAIHVSPEELAAAKQRIQAEDLTVLGLRFTEDWICPPPRFESLRRELGRGFEGIEINSAPGNPHCIRRGAHSVLTLDLVDDANHPTRQALDRVLDFLAERLRP